MEYPDDYSGTINLRAEVDQESDIDGYSIYLGRIGATKTVFATRSAEISIDLPPAHIDDEIDLTAVPKEVLSKFQRQLELFGHDDVLDEAEEQGVTVTKTVVEVTFDEYTVDERNGYYVAKRNGTRINRDELPSTVREYSDWVIGVEED